MTTGVVTLWCRSLFLKTIPLRFPALLLFVPGQLPHSTSLSPEVSAIVLVLFIKIIPVIIFTASGLISGNNTVLTQPVIVNNQSYSLVSVTSQTGCLGAVSGLATVTATNPGTWLGNNSNWNDGIPGAVAPFLR